MFHSEPVSRSFIIGDPDSSLTDSKVRPCPLTCLLNAPPEVLVVGSNVTTKSTEFIESFNTGLVERFGNGYAFADSFHTTQSTYSFL